MHKLSISIVLPVYNGEDFIEECIESILLQSFSDFELIIIDDGSIDNTVSLIQKHEDSRIKLIKNNHNFVQSLNLGISLAQGKYIVRMDADDIMVQNRLEKQFYFMKSNPNVDICAGWIKVFGEHIPEKVIVKQLTHNQVVLLLLLRNPLCHPSIIMKKELTDIQYPFYNEDYIYAEDYKLWVDLAVKECQFAVIPEVLINYRISNKQVSHAHQDEMLIITEKIQKEYFAYISEKINQVYPDLNNILLSINNLYKNEGIGFKCAQHLLFTLYSEVTKSFETKE